MASKHGEEPVTEQQQPQAQEGPHGEEEGHGQQGGAVFASLGVNTDGVMPPVVIDTSATTGMNKPLMQRFLTKTTKSDVEIAVEVNGPPASVLVEKASHEHRDAAQEAAWQSKLSALDGCVYIGHTNTDMDSIGSAIACAELYGGTAARATRRVNNEIKTCLEFWGLEQPPMFHEVPGVGNRRVCLVDHQQTTQFAEGLREDQVCGVIDHHSLKTKTVCTAGPIFIDIRPWGSACTILAFDFFAMCRMPSKPVAGMLLSGILSDTLNLKGPTTTQPDRVMVAALAQVAQVADINELARMQFRAKSAELSVMTDTEIVLGDHKVFEFSCPGRESFNVGFGVCECVSPAHAALLKRAAGLREEVLALKAEKKLEYSFFAVVDIVELRSHLIVCGPAEAEVAELAFGSKVVDGILDLGGRVSRKNDFMKNGVFPILSNPDFKPSALAREVSAEQQSQPVSPLAMDKNLGCCGRVTRECKISTAVHAVRAMLKFARSASGKVRAIDDEGDTTASCHAGGHGHSHAHGEACASAAASSSVWGSASRWLLPFVGAAGLIAAGAAAGRWGTRSRR